MTDLIGLLRVLGESGVECIIAGGVAANLLGSARTTIDVDVIYRRTDENMQRLVSALEPWPPYLRSTPAGLPFRFDLPTLRRGLNFAAGRPKALAALSELEALLEERDRS